MADVIICPMNANTYYIVTLGCQMNERDSETIAGILEDLGMSRAESEEDARVLVIVTCSVRLKPQEKAFSRLGEWRILKEQRPDRIIAVCGCMSQVATDEVKRRAPYADIVIGPRSLGHFREAVEGLLGDGCRPFVHADSCELLPAQLPARRRDGVSAFVNINYGCNNYCAYCIVPFARGPEVSRQPDEIRTEVMAAIEEGYQDITLLGQNVNSYGQDLENGMEFADLLAEIGELSRLKRLRFTTSHPKDISVRLLETMASVPTICEHLHLPMQAGDDEVLERMGRGYTFEKFLTSVHKARELMPDISVTTDVMVGFPGETYEQFENTLRAFEIIRFDQAFMFKYNIRPGTQAADMPDQIPEEEKQRRLLELVKLQNQISREVNQATVGQKFEVLVERQDPKSPECVRGRSRQNKIMIFPGSPELIGKTAIVRAEEGFLWGHKGTLLELASNKPTECEPQATR